MKRAGGGGKGGCHIRNSVRCYQGDNGRGKRVGQLNDVLSPGGKCVKRAHAVMACRDSAHCARTGQSTSFSL